MKRRLPGMKFLTGNASMKTPSFSKMQIFPCQSAPCTQLPIRLVCNLAFSLRLWYAFEFFPCILKSGFFKVWQIMWLFRGFEPFFSLKYISFSAIDDANLECDLLGVKETISLGLVSYLFVIWKCLFLFFFLMNSNLVLFFGGFLFPPLCWVQYVRVLGLITKQLMQNCYSIYDCISDFNSWFGDSS